MVTALGGLGSHILALRKSEPTLEDVFVELVGRGFGDEAEADPTADPASPAADPAPTGDVDLRGSPTSTGEPR